MCTCTLVYNQIRSYIKREQLMSLKERLINVEVNKLQCRNNSTTPSQISKPTNRKLRFLDRPNRHLRTNSMLAMWISKETWQLNLIEFSRN